MATTKKPTTKKTAATKTTPAKKPTAKKSTAKTTAARTPAKQPVVHATPAKKAPAKAKKTQAQPVRSFRVSKNDPSFTTFKITRQTVYWIILVSFIVFMQLWILKVQFEVVDLINQQSIELVDY